MSEPAARDPRRPFALSPFSRLARAHALGIAGDAMFAIGLAGSVFFDLDFNSARWRVALYLVLTIAPFAVAAPAIGPMIDRIKGGRRWIIVGSMALRALLCFLVIRHMSSLLFYPEAFMMLVLGKVYSISKSAVVPSMIPSDEALVEANSKLTVISALAVVVAAGPAGLLLKLGGPGWALGLAMLVFVGATVLALKIPPVSVAVEPVDEAERSELRSAGILLASSSMGVARGIVGFLAFMLAFDFKNNGSPLWHLGIVAAAAQIGFFLGALAAPQVRRVMSEEQILIANLATIMVGGFVTAAIGGMAGAAIMSALVGMTSSAARQAFDAIVQRDAPDANRGRSFAKFEMRFQLMWVIGALLPIIIPIPAELGFMIIALAAAATGISYSIGMWRIKQGRVPPKRRKLRVRLVATGEEGRVGEGRVGEGRAEDVDATVVRVTDAPTRSDAHPGTPQPPGTPPASSVAPTIEQPGAQTGGSTPEQAVARTLEQTGEVVVAPPPPRPARPQLPDDDWRPPPGWVKAPLEEPEPSHPEPSHPEPSYPEPKWRDD